MTTRTRFFWIATLFTLVALGVAATDSPQFGGPTRDGLYPETDLLASWPESGPKMLWSADGLGEGYAAVSVAGGRIYVTGMKERRGSVHAFDLKGKRLWQKEYGEEHSGNGYPGTRTTPTVDGDTLYLLSSMGKAVALDAATGAVRWEVDLFERFGGKNLYFGIAESPLVDGERVIYTAGGKDASVVALDKKTGETVWTTKGLSDSAAYCSPRIHRHGDQRQIVTLVAKHLVGIDPESGTVLWRQPFPVQYDIHAVSPVFVGDGIYVSHGYNQGGKLFRVAADGKSVKEAWSEDELDVHHGNAVAVDGHIYGASSNKTWYALDAETGEIAATIKRLGKGSIVHADGRLYGYVESGHVHLVDPDPKNFKVISSLEIKKGDGHHWAHPVISDGVLYIRHGDALMAYDVKSVQAKG